MACGDCGSDRPIRRVLILALAKALERAGVRDVQHVPNIADIVDGAERELLALTQAKG